VRVGRVYNTSLANSGLVYCSVEGSGRINGDSVTAEFSNIRIKAGTDTYDESTTYNSYTYERNAGLKVNNSFTGSTGKVSVTGTITGLGANQDWDSAYENVSGVVRFTDGF